MKAVLVMMIGDQEKNFEVEGESLPEVDDDLLGDLQDLPGVAWAQRGYGDTWLRISAEELPPLDRQRMIEAVRTRLGQLDLTVRQVLSKPAKV